MRFKVLNRERVGLYNVNEKHIVISISDLDQEDANLSKDSESYRLASLFLKFSDFDGYTPQMPEEIKKSLFNKELAILVWNLIDTYKDEIDLIVVNCEAGISRSPGMVAAISKILNGEDDYFFKHFLPNMLVYRTMLNVKEE